MLTAGSKGFFGVGIAHGFSSSTSLHERAKSHSS
jgi:hypothetical protein